MTISTIPSAPISINQLVLLALKRAAVVPIEARLSGANMTAKLEHGRQTLDIMLDGLATEGFMARTMGFYDLPIVAGENTYALPDTVLDVIEDAMYVPPENPDTKHTSGELICQQMDLSTWQTLTTKGSISTRPQLYVAERSGATIKVKFWPVPSESGVMRMKTVRLLGGSGTGTKSPDLQRYWFDALVWMLAHYIAVDSSMSAEKIAMLQATAEQKKAACVRYSFEHTSQQATLAYPSQWSS